MAAKKSVKVPEVSSDNKVTAAQTVAKQVTAEASVRGLRSADVVRKIGDLGLNIQASLDSVKNLTLESLQEYNNLQSAIELATSQLEELRGKEATAISLAELLAEHTAMAEAHASTMAAYAAEVAATKDENDKARLREVAEYEYKRNRERQLEADDFTGKVAARNRANEESERVLRSSWAVREEALKKQEADYADAIKMKDQIPALIDSAVKKEVAIATNALSREHRHATELEKITNNNTINLLRQQVSDTEKAKAQLEQQVAMLAVKLEAAEKRVETIAVNAMQSASGRQALDAVQQNIATTSAATRTGK